jgi:hypothetical protein
MCGPCRLSVSKAALMLVKAPAAAPGQSTVTSLVLAEPEKSMLNASKASKATFFLQFGLTKSCDIGSFLLF